jgi:hypothetical protein
LALYPFWEGTILRDKLGLLPAFFLLLAFPMAQQQQSIRHSSLLLTKSLQNNSTSHTIGQATFDFIALYL